MNRTDKCQAGFTLLEVLITIVILAFGLLGLTNLQTKLHMSQMESYQRAQAVVLVQDFAHRIQANGANADDYVTDLNDDDDVADANEWLGTGNNNETCPPATVPPESWETDRCAWQDQLLGSAETEGGADVGAAIGMRGCVEELEAPTVATCTPGRYRVTVAWQGLYETAAPGADLSCAQGQYGNDALRRVVSTTITVGLPKCLP